MASPRVVPGRTDDVVIIGAGLGGLSAALRLTGAGRRVTVLERAAEPGGRAGVLRTGGYRFDTGPTVLTMPELIDEALSWVGERLTDRLELLPLAPAYRANFADGSTIDVHTDPARMEQEIAEVVSDADAAGYRRLVAFLQRLYRAGTAQLHRPQPRLAGSTGGQRRAAAAGNGRPAPAGTQGRPVPEGRPASPDLLLPGHVRRAGTAGCAGHLRRDRLYGYRCRRVLPARRHPRAAQGACRRGGRARRAVPLRHRRPAGSRCPAAGRGRCTPPTASASRPTWWWSTPTCRPRTGNCWNRGTGRAGSTGCATRRPACSCMPDPAAVMSSWRTTPSSSARPGARRSGRSSTRAG